jgi:hypothetical protein
LFSRTSRLQKVSHQKKGRISIRNRLKMASRTSPTTQHNLTDLVCGIPVVDSPYIDKDYVGLVNRLRADLTELHPYIQASIGPSAGIPSSAVFPFLARKFLELSLTALLTRIDPLRVIAARKNQLDASFEPGRQNFSSVSWSGDLLPSEKPPISPIWDSINLKKGVERSFLGWHITTVAISDGLRWLTDEEDSQSLWLRELSAQDNPTEWIRGRLGRLYSTLSKGVHAEYLLDDGTAFDQASVQQHMHDCYMLVILLAAATHRSPLFLRSISHDCALATLRSYEHQITSNANHNT